MISIDNGSELSETRLTVHGIDSAGQKRLIFSGTQAEYTEFIRRLARGSGKTDGYVSFLVEEEEVSHDR